jgi:DNA-binding IclR family transcriptional regulator
MDRLEAMTILLAAVDTGSLSGASRHLRIPLATVSRRVAELEKHLKVRCSTGATFFSWVAALALAHPRR